MPRHNSVPTTCTASQISDWSISGLNDKNDKVRVNTRLSTVNDLIKQGFKLDFALLFITVTNEQTKNYGLDEFFPKIGFEMVHRGSKFDEHKAVHRHKETGDLFLWATSPKVYKEALEAYQKELVSLKDKIDPPKKPDPKRLAYPSLLLKHLRKAGHVFDNSKMDNPIEQILEKGKTPDMLAAFITMEYGWDPRSRWGANWVKQTTRSIKDAHEAWRNELV